MWKWIIPVIALVALGLPTRPLLADEPTESPAATSQVESREIGTSCRKSCLEEGLDEDECDMECNWVAEIKNPSVTVALCR